MNYTSNDIIEEPDAVVPHVRICMGAAWVTGRSTMTERGSKINKTSHVLDLRHVVAGLSALTYVGSLCLASFVPGAK